MIAEIVMQNKLSPTAYSDLLSFYILSVEGSNFLWCQRLLLPSIIKHVHLIRAKVIMTAPSTGTGALG